MTGRGGWVKTDSSRSPGRCASGLEKKKEGRVLILLMWGVLEDEFSGKKKNSGLEPQKANDSVESRSTSKRGSSKEGGVFCHNQHGERPPERAGREDFVRSFDGDSQVQILGTNRGRGLGRGTQRVRRVQLKKNRRWWSLAEQGGVARGGGTRSGKPHRWKSGKKATAHKRSAAGPGTETGNGGELLKSEGSGSNFFRGQPKKKKEGLL